MRTLRAFLLSLLAVCWLGCSTTPGAPLQQAWDEAAVECDDPEEDRCVTLLCLGDACGFYRCEDMPSGVELARFPGARPPAAAPGSGPRRNWGGAGTLPGGAVMVFPNWNGAPERIIPRPTGSRPGASRSTTFSLKRSCSENGSKRRASRSTITPCRFRMPSTGGFTA